MAIKNLALYIPILFCSCSFTTTKEPIPGPDKQGASMLSGAALGAGTGAVYGAQVSAGTGPGALGGAAIGAVFGAITGIGQDILEEDDLEKRHQKRVLRERLWAQEVMTAQYERRLELHPNREIYPADLFFDGDSTEMSFPANLLVKEIAKVNKERKPWSRIVIAAYVSSKDTKSNYASFLSERRAQNIATEFIREGIQANRVLTQSVILDQPLIIDPDDLPSRYNQAIEIIAID